MGVEITNSRRWGESHRTNQISRLRNGLPAVEYIWDAYLDPPTSTCIAATPRPTMLDMVSAGLWSPTGSCGISWFLSMGFLTLTIPLP